MDFVKSKFVNSFIDERKEFLNNVSKEIWENPELKFEEFKAHNFLTGILKKEGFEVIEEYILKTAFRAEYPSGEASDQFVVRNVVLLVSGPVIAVLCEYDALPDQGHACGHNLIAEAGIAAGLAIKAALEINPNFCGKVVVLGTPAEEGGSGKVFLIKGGAFDDIDLALMVHPSPSDHMFPPFIAVNRVKVTYKGRSAHASGYPWEGVNALDAAVSCYNSIALLRQQIKPNSRIHGIITKGGSYPSIIPDETELQLYIRAATLRDLRHLSRRVEGCIKAAAVATGCEVAYQFDKNSVDALLTNKVLANLYQKHAETLGVVFQDSDHGVIPFMASTDMGNVSHVVPSIHPTYTIGTVAPNHSIAFAQAAGAPAAQEPTLAAAKSMALLALDIFDNPALLEDIKIQFHQDIAKDEPLVLGS
ncbi:hypothetical protein LAZ67_1001365 [Cordylochernes scorpioides]|uniref:Peptidase M20 domain-containing protein 2 n=1 Tax=Cordylochernes scorpioides TaxID=51811 RepID=A0ABY6K017_9ARAC|nr:hypothetical protein LAZ67_1001365 [Cordylochernes scorpioides]